MDKTFNLCNDDLFTERFSKYSYAFDKVFKTNRPGNRMNKNTAYRYENNMDIKFTEALDELQIYSPLYKQLSKRINDTKFHTLNNSTASPKKFKSYVKSNNEFK